MRQDHTIVDEAATMSDTAIFLYSAITSNSGQEIEQRRLEGGFTLHS
jgi:hypothetical protein